MLKIRLKMPRSKVEMTQVLRVRVKMPRSKVEHA